MLSFARAEPESGHGIDLHRGDVLTPRPGVTRDEGAGRPPRPPRPSATRALAVAVALGLLSLTLGAGPSAAQTPPRLPVGQADGIRIDREHGHLVVRFTRRAARLYRGIAGESLSYSCYGLAHRFELGVHVERQDSGSVPVPKRRRPIRIFKGGRRFDYCSLRVRLGPHRTRTVNVPLTQRGAIFVDEQAATFRMSAILALASLTAALEDLRGFPTGDDLIAALSKTSFLTADAEHLVALAAPGDSPPPGKIGYWSDGAENIAVVTVSASGRRLYIHEGPDQALTTNVAPYLFRPR